jgi:hypothetical protein
LNLDIGRKVPSIEAGAGAGAVGVTTCGAAAATAAGVGGPSSSRTGSVEGKRLISLWDAVKFLELEFEFPLLAFIFSLILRFLRYFASITLSRSLATVPTNRQGGGGRSRGDDGGGTVREARTKHERQRREEGGREGGRGDDEF